MYHRYLVPCFYLQLDSNSFFHDLVPGVDNDGSGIVVALAVAKALGALKRNVSLFLVKITQNFIFIISFCSNVQITVKSAMSASCKGWFTI